MGLIVGRWLGLSLIGPAVPIPWGSRRGGGAADRLIGHLADRGIAVEDRPLPAGVSGRSAGGRITLDAHLGAAERFSVLAHEAAHELLHHGPDADRSDRTALETEAEAVAFVVASGVGLEAEAASSDYIQLYGGDRAKLIARLHRIRRVAGELLDAARPPNEATAAEPASSKPAPAPAPEVQPA